MNDVVLNEIVKKLIISKEDFNDYFNGKSIITVQECEEYYIKKYKLI